MTRTSPAYREGARQGWEKRRQRDDFGNGYAIRPDGTLRPDTYRDDPETGCRIWLLSVTESGTPQASNNAGHPIRVRNEIYRRVIGDPGSNPVGAACGNQRCVALDHMHLGQTPSKVGLREQRIIAELGGKLPSSVLASRLGLDSVTVRRYRAFDGVIPYHQINQRYAEVGMPERPGGVSDRDWDLACYSLHRSLQQTGAQFGLTRERARQIIAVVLAAIDREQEGVAA
jgi:hypothetical protein